MAVPSRPEVSLSPRRRSLRLVGAPRAGEPPRNRARALLAGLDRAKIAEFVERHLWGLGEAQDVRRQTIARLAERLSDEDAVHARQVTRLALVLYDATHAVHHLGARERELLEFSALLHDIGRSVSITKHHKHSSYLIANGALDGFAPEEIDVIAAVARFHRGAAPKPCHKSLAGLPSKARTLVAQLAAMLRIADGLDRSHRSVVRTMTIFRRGRKIRLYVDAPRDSSALELWAAARGAELYRRVFGVAVEFKPRTTKPRR
jgi:exopolyphosphatase / guanosine-5'-triphosphate,3'-diphosphate pyrophosphatase